MSDTAPALLLAAALACGTPSATAAPAAPAARPTPSPDQPTPRKGDYRVLKIGQKAIQARCVEGGTVIVATHPAKPGTHLAPRPNSGTGTRNSPRPRGISAERDAAIRGACMAVDYTK